MMSKIINDLIKKIPLRTRLQVLNEMVIMSFLIDIGYIPDGGWDDEKEERYSTELRGLTEKLTKAQIREFNEWEKNGRPE